MSLDDILLEVEEKMAKTEEFLVKEFSGVRTGKASPGLVENIMVEVYGSQMRLREVAGITTPEHRMLVIQPWAVVLATPVFIVVILLTRYVSLGSLLGSAAMVVVVLAWWLFASGDVPLAYPLYATVGCGLVWLAHADNIERLLHGTERKFDLGLLGRDDPAGSSS